MVIPWGSGAGKQLLETPDGFKLELKSKLQNHGKEKRFRSPCVMGFLFISKIVVLQ